jgi:hypothetical protein
MPGPHLTLRGKKGNRVSEIPCRVSNIARDGSDPVKQPAQIGGAHTVPCRVPRVIPRVRSSHDDPRNDSGGEIPGWNRTVP